MPNLVTFRTGTKAQYDALVQKDANSLYFITDAGHEMLFKGTVDMSEQFSISASPLGGDYIRLTRKLDGQSYDLPLGATVNGFIENNLVLHYHRHVVTDNESLLDATQAISGRPGTGTFLAGEVYRVELDFGNDDESSYPYVSPTYDFNPGQFAKNDALTARHHDLIITLYAHDDHEDLPYESNHSMFAVIPSDLINLVTSDDDLGAEKVILGAGGRKIKAMNFNGALKVLRTNAQNNGVEWVEPGSVTAEVVWNSIE